MVSNIYWVLEQENSHINYEAFAEPTSKIPVDYRSVISKYLRADFKLKHHQAEWISRDENFAKFVGKPVRVLSQDPLENIISFICSQNNNIKR